MTAVIGISAFYHQSAAALVVDDHMHAVAPEERIRRKKHNAGFLAHAIDYVVQCASVALSGVDCITVYDKRPVKFNGLLESYG